MAHRTFPPELMQTQRDWNRTYEALARRPRQTAALCRRLRELSGRLAAHPYWNTRAGRSPAAKVELRLQVRSQEEAESS
ncbi:hypothetical protein ACWDWT_26390 [Streptomyces sp. NPDC003343]